jgi:hypothetical protein
MLESTVEKKHGCRKSKTKKDGSPIAERGGRK